jgi:hypothetical protein
MNKIEIKNKIKNKCINRAEMIFIIGSILILKTTFLTKKLYSEKLNVAFIKASEKKNHGTIPQISHNTNGYPSGVLPLLNPIAKTNQYSKIVITGFTNAQIAPK